MTLSHPADFAEFCAFSARLGQNPLRVQGPGGNTSIKDGPAMWIKASGTELANAESSNIFVPVDRKLAQAEAFGEAGDGSCKSTVLDPKIDLRPSIETTFHAALDWPVVAHTHSIATLVHAVSVEGCKIAQDKLSGLPAAVVPYAKPGLPLTRQILARAESDTQVFVLANHGMIVCGPDVASAANLLEKVEERLAMPPRDVDLSLPNATSPDGFDWTAESWIAREPRAATLAMAGSYYPDHVVFLGPALPKMDHEGKPPAYLVPDVGIALRKTATSSQRAMLTCLSDLLLRLPNDWQPGPIGEIAEAELLDWDAEKYRQALAARQ